MHKTFLKTSVIFAALSVIVGAYTAHKLRGTVSDQAYYIFETAVRYQFYHAIALLFTGILYKQFPFKTTLWAGRFFIIGIFLFCGSLYILGWAKAAVKPGYEWLGPITPFGGLCFILGWVLLFIAFFKKTSPNK